MNENVRNAVIDLGMDAARNPHPAQDGPLPITKDVKTDYFRIALEALRTGKTEIAEQGFRMAVAEFSGDPACHHNLGSFLAVNRRFDEAAEAYETALSILPDDHETLLNLGRVYLAQRNATAAAEKLSKAMGIAPDHAETRLCLGDAARRLTNYALVVEVLEPVLADDPSNPTAVALAGASLVKLGRFADHIEMLHRFADRDGEISSESASIVMDFFANPAIDTALENDLLHRLFGKCHQRQATNAPPASRDAGVLSIGYLSNYADKPNYFGFMQTLAAAHDPERFRVTIYADVPSDAIQIDAEIVHSDRLDNAALAERIRADGIDILVDINGFSAIDRLPVLSMRPAPVIVSWFNTFSTLGIPSVDYLIADETVVPETENRFFAEDVHRVSGCYLLWHGASRYPDTSPPPMLRNGYCTFGSLASNHKINPLCIDAWAAVLHRVPGSRFLMRNPASNMHVAEFYKHAFAARGIDAERITVLPGCEHYAFVQTYERIDIALDTFSWNGGTTTLEGLWQGVPVVTLNGDRWVARAAASILKTIGRPEWIGETVDDYVDIAVSLAGDAAALGEMRSGQRERIAASPLCDAPGFARKLEAAYVEMHERAGGSV